jgi:hypothetical protein
MKKYSIDKMNNALLFLLIFGACLVGALVYAIVFLYKQHYHNFRPSRKIQKEKEENYKKSRMRRGSDNVSVQKDIENTDRDTTRNEQNQEQHVGVQNIQHNSMKQRYMSGQSLMKTTKKISETATKAKDQIVRRREDVKRDVRKIKRDIQDKGDYAKDALGLAGDITGKMVDNAKDIL